MKDISREAIKGIVEREYKRRKLEVPEIIIRNGNGVYTLTINSEKPYIGLQQFLELMDAISKNMEKKLLLKKVNPGKFFYSHFIMDFYAKD